MNQRYRIIFVMIEFVQVSITLLHILFLFLINQHEEDCSYLIGAAPVWPLLFWKHKVQRVQFKQMVTKLVFYWQKLLKKIKTKFWFVINIYYCSYMMYEKNLRLIFILFNCLCIRINVPRPAVSLQTCSWRYLHFSKNKTLKLPTFALFFSERTLTQPGLLTEPQIFINHCLLTKIYVERRKTHRWTEERKRSR